MSGYIMYTFGTVVGIRIHLKSLQYCIRENVRWSWIYTQSELLIRVNKPRELSRSRPTRMPSEPKRVASSSMCGGGSTEGDHIMESATRDSSRAYFLQTVIALQYSRPGSRDTNKWIRIIYCILTQILSRYYLTFVRICLWRHHTL